MIGRMASPRAPRRPIGVACCTIMLLLGLLVTGCSDAYTEEEKAEAEGGGESTYTLITAAPGIAPIMERLAADFMLDNPDARLLVVPRADDLSVDDLAADPPAIWVDDAAAQASLAGTAAVTAPQVALGSDMLVAITPNGNPGGIDDLSPFDATTQFERSVLCEEDVPCGRDVREALRELGITPSPGRTTRDPATMRIAVGRANMLVGILHRTDLAPMTGDVELHPELLGEDAGRVDYSLLSFSSSDEVGEFVEWVNTSPAARAVIEGAGLLPPAGA